MLVIDGSVGEGGGQVLRSALGLSLVTGTAFQMVNVRARRSNPGLRNQHLTAVRAAAQIGQAELLGDAVGSRELTFHPGRLTPGEYRFDIGTAGSVSLVLETVLPALITARGPSTLQLVGGTHNPLAPTADFLAETFLPLVSHLGPSFDIQLDRYGFFPQGGGKVSVKIEPTLKLAPLTILQRGRIVRISAEALVSRLPLSIAQRELRVIGEALNLGHKDLTAREIENAAGPGNVVAIRVESEHLTELFTGFGRRGVPAERVAKEAIREARHYLDSEVPVGPHLADQLLLPLALAGRGAFRTTEPTDHMTTNIAVIERFLDVRIGVEPVETGIWQVEIGDPPGGH